MPGREPAVRVSYKPVEELVILEMVEYNILKLAETAALLIDSGMPVILNWAEGVAFYHQPLPFSSKELLKERMRGRIYWASVIYAAMAKYRPTLKVGARDIPVLMNPNPVLRQVAAWLKKRLGEA
ncbi:MAG: hypothetical protein JSV18_00295 [Candidatus Bathyarchaeota archaeon]|nr:MAG: hypothetical protein JSV18_00295 [Candidatus Bathyarchaeota archaeon]